MFDRYFIPWCTLNHVLELQPMLMFCVLYHHAQSRMGTCYCDGYSYPFLKQINIVGFNVVHLDDVV
jgi:hypothetical protein